MYFRFQVFTLYPNIEPQICRITESPSYISLPTKLTTGRKLSEGEKKDKHERVTQLATVAKFGGVALGTKDWHSRNKSRGCVGRSRRTRRGNRTSARSFRSHFCGFQMTRHGGNGELDVHQGGGGRGGGRSRWGMLISVDSRAVLDRKTDLPERVVAMACAGATTAGGGRGGRV